MKKVTVLALSLILVISVSIAADKDIAAVELVKTLISKSTSENGYINALRFFQYTATTEKNNPSSYILSKWGKEALKESGLNVSDRGKYISTLSDRSGVRIEKLWKANRDELFKLFPEKFYDEILKEEVETLIEFRNNPEYDSMMKKMNKKTEETRS